MSQVLTIAAAITIEFKLEALPPKPDACVDFDINSIAGPRHTKTRFAQLPNSTPPHRTSF